jgi:hypothetical protein
MIREVFHRLVFPVVVVSVITCVWVAAWSKSLVDEASRGTWPALPVQHHVVAPQMPSTTQPAFLEQASADSFQ